MTNDDERDYEEEAYNREAYRAEQEEDTAYFEQLEQEDTEPLHEETAMHTRAYLAGY